jgi:hypothetical protein
METAEKENPANRNCGHSNKHTQNVSETRANSQWRHQQNFEKRIINFLIKSISYKNTMSIACNQEKNFITIIMRGQYEH